MWEALPLDKLLNGGGWAIAFWVVFYLGRMVYTGKLVPWRTHEATMKALEIERERNDLLMEQLVAITDSVETFETFVRALPQPPALPAVRVPSRQGPARRARGQQREPEGGET